MTQPACACLPDVRDRARAAFLGLALGDALGATVEFMTAGRSRRRTASTGSSPAAAGST